MLQVSTLNQKHTYQDGGVVITTTALQMIGFIATSYALVQIWNTDNSIMSVPLKGMNKLYTPACSLLGPGLIFFAPNANLISIGVFATLTFLCFWRFVHKQSTTFKNQVSRMHSIHTKILH